MALGAQMLGVVPDCRAEERRRWTKRWWASVGLVAAANLADLHSSRGLAETNPLLRNRQGGMDLPKSVLVKSAASGGFLLLEAILLRKAPEQRLEKPFTAINCGVAAAVAGTAVRNYRISRVPPGGTPR
ncbi:MAG TPA: hypothetical protein VLH09_03660 [Bryobacteraceae bacterium]|nr:hypothetical protein [Bryobacteraceae bacterium]